VVEEKAPPRKQGLHGWKAAGAVFGCGTLAAFVVFGSLVGLIGLFFNFTATGADSQPGAAETSAEFIGEPQATIEPGDLDLCSRNLSSSSKLSLTRTDAGDNYTDTVDAEERHISDQCEWELIPDYDSAQNWTMNYKYDAVISSPGGERADIASAEFDGWLNELESEFVEIHSQGQGDLADRSYFVYGEISPGVTGYILLAQTRSAVYEIRLEASSDSASGELVPENAMYHEASKAVSVSEVEFKIWIPGSD
jgi:hypothetical protein